ncbi:hypothetical protein JOC78_000290 [Bacillus ectoiniformans]|uniref:hypothetical protein n=1 Tax=Bacillus ectoiniformans TaxID=1494429 RepID=UPI00195C8D99|nr:hypothetical protein [Bacillus ectoiniformans]MBM7647369.1 hypothetical protein [Bacillus ectoiniformans]
MKAEHVTSSVTHASTQAFLSTLIDYAGLFPPAKLPLNEAVQNYAHYCRGEHAWMLGPFIIPAAQLADLSPFLSMFSNEQPMTISAIGQKGLDEKNAIQNLKMNMSHIQSFRSQFSEEAKVEVFELPLPAIELNQSLLSEIASQTGELELKTFCEVSVPEHLDWHTGLTQALDALALHNKANERTLGVKMRMGGLTPDAFPAPERAADVLIGCRDRGLSLKFTAGLHHPIRMYRDEVQTKMHGFLNVFAAGMLAHRHNLTKEQVIEILTDEAPGHFTFSSDQLAWKDASLTAEEISGLRKKFVCSYGSCSFDEPREDLEALGIL